VPVDGSHWLSMREVLDSLQQKGHEVVVVAPEVSLHIKRSRNLMMKMYPVPFTQEELEKEFQQFVQITFEEGSFLTRFLKVYKGMKRITDFGVSSCEELVKNQELIKYLKESKF
ncbi:UD11 glucuronosyltransferase, partial [Sakesphorus luctuosus]|nr:UD11 glucuronosyltransferase [Sakesphorus luctuosus]